MSFRKIRKSLLGKKLKELQERERKKKQYMLLKDCECSLLANGAFYYLGHI